MILLALEFSSTERSAALLHRGQGSEAGQLLASVCDSHSPLKAMELIQSALSQAAVTPKEVAGLIVGLGPGSYTGIRSALAIAQGWNLGLCTSVMGVSSIAALAAQVQAIGLVGRVCLVVDAQRGEFYLAVYRIEAGSRHLEQPLRLASLSEVQAAASDAMIVGPEVDRWFPQGRVLFPQAQALGQCEGDWVKPARVEELEPFYLRIPQFVKAPPPRIIPP